MTQHTSLPRPEESDNNICPECGAPRVDGMTCWEQLGPDEAFFAEIERKYHCQNRCRTGCVMILMMIEKTHVEF